jgi:hypothetical protein
MIFSKEKWNGTDGLKMFVNASKAFSFETLEGPLRMVWLTFIVPLLGEDLAEVIVGIFNKDKEARSYQEQMVLMHAQNALANITLWYCFDEINTRLTDQGHQRQETDNFKSLYKYEKDELRQNYKNKGFNAIDALIDYIERNGAERFPQWAKAPANTRRVKSIVRNTAEVNDVVFINKSALVFLRLQPIIRHIEDAVLPVLLGQKLYETFMGKLGTNDKDIGTTTVEELRDKIRKVVVCKAVAELIRQTGSLTDRGLYFDTTVAGKEGNSIKAPATNEVSVAKAHEYERQAASYADALSNFIEFYMPDLYAGHPSDVFKRENDGKRTVWL